MPAQILAAQTTAQHAPQNQTCPLVDASGLSFSYANQPVLENLDLQIDAGEIVAILGPNGAGKTTLIHLLLGLLPLQQGEIRLLGHAPGSLPARLQTGVMLQQADMPRTLKVRELLQQYSGYFPAPMPMAEIIRMAGLQDILNRQYKKLSGGEKRRCQLAVALAGKPRLLFLDEPTTGLDAQSRRELWNRVRELAAKGVAIILTTHYLEEADALADRIDILHHRRLLVSGTPEQIKQQMGSKRIRCRTSLSTTTLQSMQQVESVNTLQTNIQTDSTQKVELLSQEPEQVLRQLLRHDPQLSELEVINPDLESAFLSLTADTSRE